MPYKGFLISPNERWLQEIVSGIKQWNIFWSQLFQSASGGDPIFIVGSNGCLLYHAHVNWFARRSLAKTWEKYAEAMPITVDEIASPSAQIETGVVMLAEFKPVEPPLRIESVGINYLRTEVQPLSPEEVLLLLRALPPSAQNAWTQRVVARNNDLRVGP